MQSCGSRGNGCYWRRDEVNNIIMNIKKIYNENTAFTVRHCAFCQTGAYNVFSVHFFLSVVIPKKINIES